MLNMKNVNPVKIHIWYPNYMTKGEDLHFESPTIFS